MKKGILFTLIGLIILCMLGLGACGGVETEAPAPTEPVAVEPPTDIPVAEEPPTEEPVVEEPAPVLTIWADTLFAPIIEEISRDFTAEYGVEVVVQPMGMDDVREQMKTAAPAGEGPDIIEGPHDWVGTLLEAGVIAPIDLGDKESLLLPAAVQAFTYEGNVYGLGLINENVAMFRNLDIVPEAPTTWDEFLTMADELEAEGVEYRLLLQQGDAYHFFPIQTSFGGYVFGQNPDGSYIPDDVGIDSEGSIAAAVWLDEMVKAGHIKAEIDFDTARALFTEGQAAFYLTGPWNLEFFQETGVNYVISPIPAGTEPAKPFTGVRGLMVNAFSDQLALAQTFLTEFWTTEAAIQQYYEATQKPVTLLSVRETIENPDLAALGEAGLYAMPMPAIPEMSAFWATMGDTITLILQQQADPTEAFQNAAEQMRNLIAEGQ